MPEISHNTHGNGSWARIIGVQERRQFSLPHARCQRPVHLSEPHSLYHWFNLGGTDVLLRKVTHWSLGVLVCWYILYIRRAHRKERWCTLIQMYFFSEISKHHKKYIYIFTSLDKQGNWGKDKHWCLSKFHPVSWRDRNKKNLLRTKIPSLRQPSLFSTRRLAVSNYNTPDLLLGTWLLKVLGWLDEQLFSTKVSSPHTSRSGNKRLESCLCCLAQVHRETHPACLCSARYSQDTNW